MSQGRNEEALSVFQTIYKRNLHRDTFPITSLAHEEFIVHGSKINVGETKTVWVVFKNGLRQMATIFEKPHLRNCLVLFTMQFGFLWNQNTLRLWLPSLFDMVNVHGGDDPSGSFDFWEAMEASTGRSPINETQVACSQEKVRSSCQDLMIEKIYLIT